MSKESKSRDRHRQSIEAVRDRPEGVCIGCGFRPGSDGAHRPDCLIEPSPLHCGADGCDAIRAVGDRTPVWQYNPTTRRYACPDHAISPIRQLADHGVWSS